MNEKQSLIDKLLGPFLPKSKDIVFDDEPEPVSLQEALFKNLFTAWREPDGSKGASEALDNMDYPSFCSVLPYRNYDAKSGLFINKTTIGFLLECTPLVGANEKIVDALDYFLRNKLPRKTPLTFILLGSKCISEQLGYGLKDFGWQGEEAEKFNHITRAFYERGALEGLNNKLNLPLSLRNYRLFVCYAEEHKKADALTLQKVNQTLSIVMESLAGASLHCEQMNDKGLLQLVREITNFRHDQIALPSNEVDPYESLNDQCADRSINVEIRPDAIHQSLSMEKGQKSKTRIMNYMLEKNPTQFALWQTGDNLSNLLDPASSVSCPFVITVSVYVEDLVKTQNEAKKKFITNNSRANSKYINWVPGVKRKAEEWGALREELDANQTALARYSYGISLFCEDDDDKALKAEMALMNTYTTNRLKLYPTTFMQLRNYLALFPFVMQEGLWGDMVRSGGTLRAKAFNVANLLPVVADNRICPKGLPIPSYRHQLSFLDIFQRGKGLGNDNFNAAVCGTSGSGKSFLMQALIRQVLDAGGWAYVLDMGDSYKELCHSLGGVYVDARDLKFNPFAGVVDIKEAAESIRDLLLVLANPSGDMDDTSKSILLTAVQHVWEGVGPAKRKGNKALIDDVSNYLVWRLNRKQDTEKSELDEQLDTVITEGETVRNRMHEIVVSLQKYTTEGLYGEYFNSDKPALNEQVRFTVLEMGGLQNKPDLLAAVMFSMMIFIQQRMYLTERSMKKLAAIDEGWKLLDNKSRFGLFIFNPEALMRKGLIAVMCSVLLNQNVAVANVNSDMNNFFNKLGFEGNATDARAWEGQAAGYATGGNLFLRSQVKQLQIASFTPPSINAGCGGIDAYLGSFSYMNSEQLQQFIKQMMTNGAGYLFDLALQTTVPELKSAKDFVQKMASDINSMNISSCQAAQGIIGGLWPTNTVASQKICQDIGGATNLFEDWAASRQGCTVGGQMNNAFNKAPENMKDQIMQNKNLMWEILAKSQFLSGDNELKELVMNLTGVNDLQKIHHDDH